MRAAIIHGETVTNIIEVDSLEGAEELFPGSEIADATGLAIGWKRIEGVWQPPAPTTPVLMPLTRRRLRLGLLSIGITADMIAAAIEAIVDPVERAAAMIEWEDASEYERDHPLLVDVAATFSLPPEQIDALWTWAAGL